MSMVLETVLTEGLAHLSYLIGDTSAGIAAVIDPRRDVEVYLDLARKHHVAIKYVLETHIHADFVSGALELVARTGTAQPHLSVEGGASYEFEHQPLHDGDEIELGSVILTARHTPGHTPEHMSFSAAEAERRDTPFAIFSGDCLFADSIGRPDLLGDDQAEALAKKLFHSLHDVFLKLGDEVLVHPAHGAGSPCGAEIGDRLVTTIGYERRHNKALEIKSQGKFVEFALNTSPPEPRYYKRMKKLNAAGPEVLNRLPSCPALTPKDFKAAISKRGIQFIDNRPMLAFGGGHIAGAMNIGPKPMLSIWAGWMLDPKEEIFLLLGEDSRLEEVQRQLVRVGYTKFGGYLLGGIAAWIEAGFPLETLPQISVHQLKERLDEMQIVDVRSPEEWEKGHIPGAKYLFLPELIEKQKQLSKSKPIAVYCASGYRANLGASLLQANGFTQVHNVPGSWEAWEAAGYPEEKPGEDKKASDTDRK